MGEGYKTRNWFRARTSTTGIQIWTQRNAVQRGAEPRGSAVICARLVSLATVERAT